MPLLLDIVALAQVDGHQQGSTLLRRACTICTPAENAAKLEHFQDDMNTCIASATERTHCAEQTAGCDCELGAAGDTCSLPATALATALQTGLEP